MGSNPPENHFVQLSKLPPPGLACLDLSSIRETTPSSSAAPSSLSSATAPLSDHSFALSSRCTSTESNISTSRQFIPDPLSFDPRGFFSNHSITHIPRAATSDQLFSLSKTSRSANSSFWPKYEGGKKEKKKEPKEKARNRFDGFERAYPNGYKGFLEKKSKEDGFSSKARHILGINTFADSASTSFLSQELMSLDLNAKVFVSKAGKMRISDFVGAYAKKKLLDSLRSYDRNMSFWLQDSEAYEQYARQMSAIFFDDTQHIDLTTIFEAIPVYRDLEDSIQGRVDSRDYRIIYKNIHVSFEEYSMAFSKKHKIDALEEELYFYREVLEKKEKMLIEYGGGLDHSHILKEAEKVERRILSADAEIKKRKEVLEKKQLDSVKGFSIEVRLNESFLKELFELQQEESGKVPDFILNEFPKELPEWKLDVSREYILEVSLYFFAILCRTNQKFYGASPVKNEEIIYINKIFFREFKLLERSNNVERFNSFMRSKKNNYDMGLLKIVADKTLELICENAQIRIDGASIFDEAFDAAKMQLPGIGAEPYYCYGRAFFEILSDCIFRKVEEPLIQRAELDSASMHPLSGPAPKP